MSRAEESTARWLRGLLLLLLAGCVPEAHLQVSYGEWEPLNPAEPVVEILRVCKGPVQQRLVTLLDDSATASFRFGPVKVDPPAGQSEGLRISKLFDPSVKQAWQQVPLGVVIH